MLNPKIQDALDKVFAEDGIRPQRRKDGLLALQRLIPVSLDDTGQSRVIGRFLLGLWNGRAYPFDLTELRGLDSELYADCLAVLQLDRLCEREVHEYIKGGWAVWDQLRNRYH